MFGFDLNTGGGALTGGPTTSGADASSGPINLGGFSVAPYSKGIDPNKVIYAGAFVAFLGFLYWVNK